MDVVTLVPDFVRRMSPAMRDKALDFWNDVVRRYVCPGATRDALPDSLREVIDLHVFYHDDPAPSDLLEYSRFDTSLTRDVAAGVYENLDRVLRSDGTNPMVRILRVTADLYVLAPTMIMLWHWAGFIRHLLGGYAPSAPNVHPTALQMLADGPSKRLRRREPHGLE